MTFTEERKEDSKVDKYTSNEEGLREIYSRQRSGTGSQVDSQKQTDPRGA